MKRHIILIITTGIISEVVDVMGDMMSERIRINWLDLLIREIHEERECQKLVQQVNTLRV